MRFVFLVLLLLVGLGTPSESRPQDKCESLFHESCRAAPDQVTTDATGSVLGFDDAREYRRIFEDNGAKFAAKGLALARASVADGSFRSVIDSLGLKNVAICRAQASRAKCVELAGATLGQILMVDLSNKRAGRVETTRVPLERLLALVRGVRYQKAEAELSTALEAASSPEFAKKASALVVDLRAEVIAAARRFLPETLETEKLLAKVAKVEYADDQCPPMIFGSSLSAIAGIGAFYDESLNKVRICRGLASSVSSLYSLSSILAHEITHSIDPCTIRGPRVSASLSSPSAGAVTLADYDASSPWGPLASCLRDPKSMDAKFIGNVYSAAHCREDQLVEAIPDFIASEVVGSLIKKGTLPARSPDEAMRGLANAWRIGCSAPDMGNDDPHSTIEHRIQRTLALQPQVRKALACGPIPREVKYCGGVGTAPNPVPARDVPASPRRTISSIEDSRRSLVVHAQLGEARTEITLVDPKSLDPLSGHGADRLAEDDFEFLFALAKALPAAPGRAPANCSRGSMTVELRPSDGKTRSACIMKISASQKPYQKLAEALRWQKLR